MLGLAVFASQFPSFLFSPLGGVVSDRYNRYRVLLFTQIASLVQAAVLTILVFFTHYAIWEIYLFSVLLGIINAFDVPARQSMVNDIISRKEDLPNAIALNSSMVNAARLLGPAVSGIVLENFGAAVCFLINAVSFIAVISSLLLMRLPAFVPQRKSANVFADVAAGWNYLRRTPSIGTVILLLACVSLLVLPFNTLLAVYARVMFRGGAAVFGYLNSAIGLGAVTGAFFLASLKPGVNLKKVLFINLLVFGLALMLFSHMQQLPFALLFAALAGFGMMSQTTISNTIVQTGANAAMRGRAISYFVMAFSGMQPLGGLLVGLVSEYISAPNTLLAEGIAAIIIALSFWPFLKKDYLREEDRLELVELEEPGVAATPALKTLQQ